MNRRILSVFMVLLETMAACAVAQDELGAFWRGGPQWKEEEIDGFLAAAELSGTESASIIAGLYRQLIAAHREEQKKYTEALQRVADEERHWREEHPDVADPQRETGNDFGRYQVFWTWRDGYWERESEFMRDVESVIPGEKRVLWKRWERDIGRRHRLRSLREDGYRSTYACRSLMNLTDLLDQVEIPPELRLELAPVEYQYAEAMDALLEDWVAWERRYADEWNANVVARIEEGTPVAEEKRARLRQNFEAGFNRLKTIDATTDRFIHQFRDQLPEPWRSEFVMLVNSSRFPDVYRKCPVEIAIDLFRDFPDLPHEQKRAEAIWSEYELQRGALRQRIVTAHERWETAEWNQYVRDLYINRLTDPYGDHPLVEDAGHPAAPLFEQVIALAQSASQQLRALFTDAEFAALPLSIQLALEWWKE